MHIPISDLAFRFLLPTALLIPLCAWAGFQLASHPKHRRTMVALIAILLALGFMCTFSSQFGLAMSPGHEDGTYYNSFYSLQLLLAPLLAICAAILGYWTWHSKLYGGAGLIALSAAVPAMWWGASRTSSAFGPPIAGPLVVAGLGALVGAAATQMPEIAPPDRPRRLVLWTATGAVSAVGGFLLGILFAGSPWGPPRRAADPLLPTLLLPTLLLITVLITVSLLPALLLSALSRQHRARLMPPAVGLAVAVAACWVALSDLPALNQSAVSAPLAVTAPRMLSLPDRPPPQPSANAAAFSPDGKWMAVGLAPESIYPERQGGGVIWRTADWTVVANVQPGAGATWPLWSPDGQQLVLVSGGGTVTVLTTGTWATARSWSRPGALAGGAITPDGRTLWLAEASALTAWGMQDDTPGDHIPLDDAPTSPPVIAPNAGWIAVGTGAVVSVWHLPTGTSWQQLPGHAKHAIHLSTSPDSTTLAVGSWDAVVRVWRVGDGALLASIPDGGESVEFSPDGGYLAGASFRGVSAIHQAGNWERRVVLQSAGMSGIYKATVLAYSPDGAWLVGAGQSLNMPLWHLPTLRARPAAPTAGPPTVSPVPLGPLQPLSPVNAARMSQAGVLQQDGLGAAFLPLSGTLAVAGAGIRLFPDPVSGAGPARRWAIDDNGLFLVASPDGRLLATRGETPHDLDLWRVDDGTRLARLTGPADNLITAAFSPDSKTVAAAGDEGIVFTWAVAEGAPPRQWSAGMARVNSLIFSPDGSTLWVGGEGADGLLLVHATDGMVVRALPASNEGVDAMALAPDGRTLAVTTDGIDIQLWRVSDGTRLARLHGLGGEIESVAWSPDGALVAAGGWTDSVAVWDASSGKRLTTLAGHTEEVYTVLFAPDGRLLVSVGGDSTVRLWGVRGP